MLKHTHRQDKNLGWDGGTVLSLAGRVAPAIQPPPIVDAGAKIQEEENAEYNSGLVHCLFDSSVNGMAIVESSGCQTRRCAESGVAMEISRRGGVIKKEGKRCARASELHDAISGEGGRESIRQA
jgi:hypothetical protein